LGNFDDRGVGNGEQNAAGNPRDRLQWECFHSTDKVGGDACVVRIAPGYPLKRRSSFPQHAAKR